MLAAGNGDRFQNGQHESKLLQPVLGQPLILRTLDTAHLAGITAFARRPRLPGRSACARSSNSGLPLGTPTFSYNPDWHLENGVSVLAARDALAGRRFALLMGDHLFEPSALAAAAAHATRRSWRIAPGRRYAPCPGRASPPKRPRCSWTDGTSARSARTLTRLRRARHRPLRLRSHRSSTRSTSRMRSGGHDAQRRHPPSRGARLDARRRRRRRDLVRHRHARRISRRRNHRLHAERRHGGGRVSPGSGATSGVIRWGALARRRRCSSAVSALLHQLQARRRHDPDRSGSRCRWRSSSAARGIWRARGRGPGAFRSRARSASRGSRACGSPPKPSAI